MDLETTNQPQQSDLHPPFSLSANLNLQYWMRALPMEKDWTLAEEFSSLSRASEFGCEFGWPRARGGGTWHAFCMAAAHNRALATQIHVYEVYAHEVHAYKVHAREVDAHDVHACEVDAHEMH